MEVNRKSMIKMNKNLSRSQEKQLPEMQINYNKSSEKIKY